LHWEEIFQERILNRGFDYYERGLVENLDVSMSSLEANVKGSKLYTVEIEYNSIDKEITELHCDCPHFESGYFCKHLAAFFFYLDNKFKDFKDLTINMQEIYSLSNIDDRTEEDTRELVAEADDATVRLFVEDVLEENPHLKEQFKGLLGHEITSQKVNEYKSDIDNLFKMHGKGSDGFIDYYSAIELDEDLSGFMHKVIEQTLLKNGFYEEAFELINHIFISLTTQPMDDSAGIIVNQVYSCQRYWRQIISESFLPFKREMYQWFKQQLSHPQVDFLEEYVEEMLFEYFFEEEFLLDKKAFAKQEFERHKNVDNEFHRRIQAPRWAERYVKTLEALGHTDEMNAFCKNNLHFARIRELYVDKLLEREQINEAVHLLEEGKAKISREYKIKLKDLYKEIDDYENYRKELWDLLIHNRSIDFDLYREFQNQYSKEECKNQKIDVLEKLSCAENIDELYAGEELYELLLEDVTKSYGLHKLKKHEKKLMPLYPDEVLDRYEKEILSMSELAGSRKKYRKIVDLLGRMRRLPHEKSKTRVSKIAAYLREEYNNRPAMMDELSQLSLK